MVVVEPSPPVVVEVVDLVPILRLLHWKGGRAALQRHGCGGGGVGESVLLGGADGAGGRVGRGSDGGDDDADAGLRCLMTLGVTVPLTGA